MMLMRQGDVDAADERSCPPHPTYRHFLMPSTRDLPQYHRQCHRQYHRHWHTVNNDDKYLDSKKLPVTVPNDAVLPRMSAVHCRKSRQNGIVWHRYWKFSRIYIILTIVVATQQTRNAKHAYLLGNLENKNASSEWACVSYCEGYKLIPSILVAVSY